MGGCPTIYVITSVQRIKLKEESTFIGVILLGGNVSVPFSIIKFNSTSIFVNEMHCHLSIKLMTIVNWHM